MFSDRPTLSRPAFALRRIASEGDALADLRAASQAEGYRHIDRLCDEWRLGANRFDGRGEALLGCYAGAVLAGVGGLNRDPFSIGDSTGRVRRLYVAPSYRWRGAGRALVLEIIQIARLRFTLLRVGAAPGDARLFYEALGFHPVIDENASHQIALSALEGPLKPE